MDLKLYENAGKQLPLHQLAYPLTRPCLVVFRKMPFIVQPKYEDQFVLLDPKNEKTQDYMGKSGSYQFTSKLSPDTDGDGLGDTAIVIPGKYELSLIPNQKYNTFWVNMGGFVPANRFLTKTKQIDYSKNYQAGQILYHCGYDHPVDSPHGSSIGCITSSQKYIDILAELSKSYGGKADLIITTTEDEKLSPTNIA